MMRLTLLASLVALAAHGAQVQLPRTSEAMNDNIVYERGEAAYEVATDGLAAIYVGGDNGTPRRVTDPSALRAQAARKMEASEWMVTVGEDVVDAGDGSYLATFKGKDDPKGAIRILPRIGKAVSSVSFDFALVSHDGGLFGDARLTQRAYANGVEIYCHSMTGCSSAVLRISNIVAYRDDEHTAGLINDATLNRFKIRDALGIYDLGNLRRDEHKRQDERAAWWWYKHHPSNVVNMAGQPLAWDPARQFMSGAQGGRFALWYGGGLVYSVSPGATNETSVTELSITSIDGPEDGQVTLGLFVAHTGAVDMARLKILWCEDIADAAWREIAYEASEDEMRADGYSHYTITLSATGARGFYKAQYDGIAQSAIVTFKTDVVFRRSVEVNGDLTVGGTNLPERIAALEAAYTTATNRIAALEAQLEGLDAALGSIADKLEDL